jgi:cytosine deaminase
MAAITARSLLSGLGARNDKRNLYDKSVRSGYDPPVGAEPAAAGLEPGGERAARSAAPDLLLRRCRLEDEPEPVDVAIAGQRIAAVGPDLPLQGRAELAIDGRLVSPAFVEPHIHLDKVDVAPLLGPNRSGTLSEAIRLLHATKRASTVDEVAQRASRVIVQALLAGTTVIRTHVDVDTIGGLTPLRGVLKAARDHQDLCDIEIVAFPQEGIRRDPGADDLMRQAMREGATIVGGMPHWEASRGDAEAHIQFCLELAREHDADVDMHVDETDDPRSRTLEMLLDASTKLGWNDRVTAGHCCAMVAWERGYRERVIAKTAAAGVSIVTNPATNLMLQGRGDAEPRRRGVAPIKELVAAGVRVACGQDCVRDAFYPLGAADPLQVALILCHAAQLSTPGEIALALRMVRHHAAEVLKLPAYGIRAGNLADMVVLEAEDIGEALRTQAARRYVIRRGRLVAETETHRELHRTVTAPGTATPAVL